MTVTDHSLVIGKFLPPHAGHDHLVRTAAAVSRRVSVLALAHPDEGLPLDDRVRWLRAMFADMPHVAVAGGMDVHPIDYDDPAVWDLHVRVFREVLAAVANDPVTAVFSSETYGEELARRFGAIHVAVDVERRMVPVSATAVRSDPVGSWDFVPSPVRAGLVRRVVVLGAESTGTTTVSSLLVDRLRARGGAHGLTRWVPEVGRAWTIDKLATAQATATLTACPTPGMEDLIWPTADFDAIARRQNELEDQLAAEGGPVLVCDTDAYVTGMWHERYLHDRSRSVDAQGRHHPLYLVTHHDGVPFHQDGIRDGEHLRAWMTERFIDDLTRTGRTFVVLTGTVGQRVSAGLDAIDRMLGDWVVAAPVAEKMP